MALPDHGRRTKGRIIAVLAGGGVIVALAVLLAVAPLLHRPAPPASPVAQTLLISMAGFSGGRIRQWSAGWR